MFIIMTAIKYVMFANMLELYQIMFMIMNVMHFAIFADSKELHRTFTVMPVIQLVICVDM